MLQAPVQSSCSTPPVPNQAHQPGNLSAGHPNHISPAGAQLQDNSQRVKHKSEEIKDEAVLPGASLEPAARAGCALGQVPSSVNKDQ